MEAQIFERSVYPGAKVVGTHSISAARFSRFKEGEKFRTHSVNNLSQYEAGCAMHRRCFGHMCKTPSGTILPPQSMSMRTMEIATEYHAASRLAFAGNEQAYVSKLKETNYTKKGTMRVTMSTPVAGSCRLITIPQWYDKKCIMISPNLASRMRVSRKVYDEEGNMCDSYIEKRLEQGDWMVIVRPPSLKHIALLRVVFWNKECMGLHPETYSSLHGDFDGDEGQGYPVYDEDSIAECKAWEVMPLAAFEEGRALFDSLPPDVKNEEYGRNAPYTDWGSEDTFVYTQTSDSNRAVFIENTTLSAGQIKEGKTKLVFGKFSRNKDAHVSGTGKRFNTSDTERSFVSESIRGMGDVCRQQLSQGALGDMSRTAKIAVSLFYRPPEGGLYVATRNGDKLLINDSIRDSGTPSVRAISSLCAVAQQAALDSHRAESRDAISHDFISDLILGCDRKDSPSPTSEYTLICLDSSVPPSLVDQCDTRWRHDTLVQTPNERLSDAIGRSPDVVILLCKPRSAPMSIHKYVYAAYNPVILSKCMKYRESIADVCKRGISIICNYYYVQMSPVELNDLVAAYTYNIRMSSNPITTREGMLSRELGWIETLLGTDYTKLAGLEGVFEKPNSSTSAMFLANFKNLRYKCDSE